MIMATSTRGRLRRDCAVWLRPAVGVSDLVPSQNNPVKPERKFDGTILTRYAPLGTSVNRKAPWESVVVVATVVPSAPVRARRRLGSPSSSGKTRPVTLGWLGEKSRHTGPTPPGRSGGAPPPPGRRAGRWWWG